MTIQDWKYFGYEDFYKDVVEVDHKSICYSAHRFNFGLYEVIIAPMKMGKTPEKTKFNFLLCYDGLTHFSSFGYSEYVSYQEIVYLLKYIKQVFLDHQLFNEYENLYKPFYRNYAKRHLTWYL